MVSTGTFLFFFLVGLHGALGDHFDNLSWEDFPKGDHFQNEHRIKDDAGKEERKIQSKTLSVIFKDKLKNDRNGLESSTASFPNKMGEHFIHLFIIKLEN